MLLTPLFGFGADGACARHLLDRASHPFPVVVLPKGQLHAGFSWVTEVRVMPLCCGQLWPLGDDNLVILIDDQFVRLIGVEEGSLAELFLGIIRFLLKSFVLCLFFLDTSVTQGVARIGVICKTVF